MGHGTNEIREAIRNHCEGQVAVLGAVADCRLEAIAAAAELLVKSLDHGGKLLVMGNGGSAADAQHFAAELVGRFRRERRALPAMALTTDTSILTAVANDYGFAEIFRRQVEALARPGDVVCGISTSGRSPNVVRALATARQIGCATLALAGGTGGELCDHADVAVIVPSDQTPYIQEAHLTIIHILCDLVEKSFAPAQRQDP